VALRAGGASWLVEQSRKDTEEKGVGQEQLENMRHSLEQVKKVLDLMKVRFPESCS